VTAAALGLLLVGASATGCSSGTDADGDGDGDVVVAADLELTGAGALAGTAYERGLQLKVEQINASGLLGGRSLSLRVLDNRSDPTTSLRNISNFAEDPQVAAVVTGACGECVVGAAKTINGKQLPTISLAAAAEVTTPVADRRFIFKIAPNAVDSAAALVAEMRRNGVGRVAVLYADNLAGRDGQRVMGSELAKARIQVSATARVTPTANDISQAVGTLVDSKPDALVVWTGSEQATLAATGARRAKFSGRLYFDAAAAGELFLPDEAARAADNTTMVFTEIMAIDDVIATTPAKVARKQWFRDYTSRYGSYSGVAAFAGDAAGLIAQAVLEAGGDRARIRQVLETSQTDGLAGPIRMTPDNHSGLMPQALTLLAARSGRWRLLN
jgi:branched-chain amino acid transport system substrate-binding protein